MDARAKRVGHNIGALKVEHTSMAAILDQAAAQSRELQAELNAAMVNATAQEDKRNLLEAEAASLRSEVHRLNAAPAGGQPDGAYTYDQLLQAVNDTFAKDSAFFEEKMARKIMQVESDYRIKLRGCDDQLEQWVEAAQTWKEKSEGQAIDLEWWESFGDAFPVQVAEFTQSSAEFVASGREPKNGPEEVPQPVNEKTPGLTTFGDTISRMHQACVKLHEPAVREAFRLDSAVSRMTTSGVAGGAKILLSRR